jgi:hypothetical protein
MREEQVTDPETPVRYFGWNTPDLGTLPGNIRRGRSIEKEQVKDTSEDIVFDILTSLGKFDIHTIRIEEENTAG